MIDQRLQRAFDALPKDEPIQRRAHRLLMQFRTVGLLIAASTWDKEEKLRLVEEQKVILLREVEKLRCE